MKYAHIRPFACLKVVAVLLGLGTSAGSQAAPFYWTDWAGSDLLPGVPFQAQGTISTGSSTVTVTYTNMNGVGFYQPSGGIDYWANGNSGSGGRDDSISPYTSSLVDNAPTGTDIIALSQAGSQTLTFSEVITNPVFGFVSLNGNGYAFDQDFEILSVGGVDGNACGYWGCGGVTKVVVDLGGGNYEYQLNSNGVGGSEPHGMIRFVDSFDTVTWRSSTDEYWNGFTVGVQGTAVEICVANPSLPECQNVSVPAPFTVLLFGAGLALLGLSRRGTL
ncbi:MAG: PEP-CTERM sorting domain-containing protein [Pseudomonadota bacterium]